MAIRFGYFDAAGDDRIYTDSDLSHHIFLGMMGSGLVPGFLDELKVAPLSPMGPGVLVGLGGAFLEGRWFEVYDSPEEMAVSPGDAGLPRKDRVILRLNYPARAMELLVKQGVPALPALPPSLSRTNEVHEASLAQIDIGPGQVAIGEHSIIDERFDPEFFGLAVPHPYKGGGLNARASVSRDRDLTVNPGIPLTILWNLPLYASPDMFSLGLSDRVAIPYPGKYQVTVRAVWSFSPGGVRVLQVYKNGLTRVAQDVRGGSSLLAPACCINTLLNLKRGDYLQVRVLHDSTVRLQIESRDRYSPILSVMRLGD